jgi:NAD-dependent dihydropyrimidine dehydrogenase PreA subunit
VLTIEIRDQACRGCRMCVEVCPTQVFDYDESTKQPTVREAADCIACLSCAYLCPSGALHHTDYPVVRNFYRDLGFSRRMERFL